MISTHSKFNLHPSGISRASIHLSMSKKIKKYKKNYKIPKNKNKKTKNHKTYKKSIKHKKTKMKKQRKPKKIQTKNKNHKKSKKNKTKKTDKNEIKYIKNIKKKTTKKKDKDTMPRMAFFLIIMIVHPEGSKHVDTVQNFIESELTSRSMEMKISAPYTRNFGTNTENVSMKSGWKIHTWNSSKHRNYALVEDWQERIKMLSRKLRNKQTRAYNGNRGARNNIHIAHWNLGNSKWENKTTEVEALLLEKGPDIIFVSEANLYASLPDHERQIGDYDLYLPRNHDGKAQLCKVSHVGQI